MKKNVFFRALPESPNPPLTPMWGGEGDILTTLKEQLKVQYISIFEEIDSFY